jgi:PhnB protein
MEPQIYLYFDGLCEEAMRFYADLFGGEVAGIFKNSSAAPGDRMPGGDDLVMNMAIKVGGTTMMASDAPGNYYHKPVGFAVSVQADSADKARRWFGVLSEGGEVSMPLAETFWAEAFGMCRDRFGTPWMVNYTGGKQVG